MNPRPLTHDDPDIPYDLASSALGEILRWVVEPVAGQTLNRQHLRVVRNRALALAWSLNPDLVGGLSLRALSRRIGLHRTRLSIVARTAREKFGLRNRYHAHDWRRR